MICDKSLLVALTIVIGAQAYIKALLAAFRTAELAPYAQSLLEPEANAEVWATYSESIMNHLPDVTYNLNGPRIQNATDGTPDTLRLMEYQLSDFFPTILCSGKLDWDAVAVATSHSRRAEYDATTSRNHRRAYDQTLEDIRTQKDAMITVKTKNFIYSCTDAPHPGNCKQCLYSSALHGIGDISHCIAAGYAAIRIAVPRDVLIGAAIGCATQMVPDVYDRVNNCFLK